jgi:uncharacterized membrane protein
MSENSPNAVSPAPTLAALPTLPKVRAVGFDAPRRWLTAGWRDIWRQPGASLFYGICVALAGLVILAITARLPYLSLAAISGFLLVSPMLATGLYELSRRYLAEEPAPLLESMLAWKRNPSGLVSFALLSLLAGTAWQVISVVLLVLLSKGSGLSPLAMMLEIIINPQYSLVFMAYVGVGGVIAALVFAASVVSMPMLVDRRCDLMCALATSFNAVSESPAPLAFWAAIIMLLSVLGFATGLLGFIIILPWLGHASFHAYKELVEYTE